MTPFSALMFWAGLCWLVYQCRVEPLQPDQPVDELADIDLSEHGRQVDLRERDWLDRPVLNVRLSRKWTRPV